MQGDACWVLVKRCVMGWGLTLWCRWVCSHLFKRQINSLFSLAQDQENLCFIHQQIMFFSISCLIKGSITCYKQLAQSRRNLNSGILLEKKKERRAWGSILFFWFSQKLQNAIEYNKMLSSKCDFYLKKFGNCFLILQHQWGIFFCLHKNPPRIPKSKNNNQKGSYENL